MFPEIIKISIVDTTTKCPIEGILVRMHLFANRKNDYYIDPKVSDSNGQIIVNKKWVWEKVLEIINSSIMDYSSNLDDCKQYIEIAIIDTEAINRALEGIKVWWGALKSPQEDIDNLEKAKNAAYKPISKIVHFNNSDELEVVIETQQI